MRILPVATVEQPAPSQHSHVRLLEERRCENCPEVATWRVWYATSEVLTINGVTTVRAFVDFCSPCGLVQFGTAGDVELLARGRALFVPTGVRPITVVEEVSRHFGFEPGELTGARRTRVLAGGRHIAIFLVRELAGLSFTEIAEQFHMLNHSSTTNAHGNVCKGLRESANLRRSIARLASDIQARGVEL